MDTEYRAQQAELAKARATLAKVELRKARVLATQAMLGDKAGICETCEAVVLDLATHRDWHLHTAPSYRPDSHTSTA